jgi:ClpP class serine protease
VPREPLRLTSATLAQHRPGALVAVALGALAGIPTKRPRPYLVARAAEVLAPGAPVGSQVRAATAVIPVRGVLTQYASISDCGEPCSYEAIEADVLAVLADPGVGRVILDVDSNGGDVPGLEDTGARIRAAAVASGKLLLGFTPGNAMSAAYWLLAMTCEGIYLSRSARIGAIGSCVVWTSEARRLAREGTDVYVGRRPAGKFRPNDVEALDDIGKARIDALADEGAVRFVEGVAALRGIPAATVEGWNAGAFTGEAAVSVGLADGTGRLEEIVALAENWPLAEAA